MGGELEREIIRVDHSYHMILQISSRSRAIEGYRVGIINQYSKYWGLISGSLSVEILQEYVMISYV